jgi:hypothetical protein
MRSGEEGDFHTLTLCINYEGYKHIIITKHMIMCYCLRIIIIETGYLDYNIFVHRVFLLASSFVLDGGAGWPQRHTHPVFYQIV